MNQSELEANACNRHQAWENACERGTVGFSFVSHWLLNWREFWSPITEHSKVKPKQTQNYFRHSIANRSNKVKYRYLKVNVLLWKLYVL